MPNKAPESKKKAESVKTVATTTVAAAKPKKAKESGAVIRHCSCVSAFQDRRYGKGQRVFCCTPKNGVRCTVCGGKQ